jgi:hypothetical protein
MGHGADNSSLALLLKMLLLRPWNARRRLNVARESGVRMNVDYRDVLILRCGFGLHVD